MSQILAQRFAAKCFTPLELTHLKDNFNSRALDQDGIQYWNEEILSKFLGIPDGSGSGTAGSDDVVDHSLDAGPVLFRMVSYLGAFPFQNTQAPCVLTFDAMVKVIVLLTERYGKVLRRGRKDRVKLLFGSLADVGRRSVPSGQEKEEKKEEEDSVGGLGTSGASHATGFSVDLPANDDEEEDDDDLALAALESLDAIEVFKHDQRVDRSVYEARISLDTLRRLLMLLLTIAPLRPTSTITKLTTELTSEARKAVSQQADSILAAFALAGDTNENHGISYKTFSKVIATSLPFLFDPLTPLFEHLLFSKNLDLSRRRESTAKEKGGDAPVTLPLSRPLSPIPLPGDFESVLLSGALFSHLSFFIATAFPVPNLFRNGTRLHPVFSSGTHGESLTRFSHHVLTWKAPSILILTGANTSSENQEMVTVGAYLPQAWKPSTSSSERLPPKSCDPSTLPCLFQLSPTHIVLQGNPSHDPLRPNLPISSFSNKTGIALGCMIPPASRTSSTEHLPTPTGGGSLLIDSALENATFVVSDGSNGEGVFLSPGTSPSPTHAAFGTKKTEISIYNLEVWGIVHETTSEPGSPGGSPDPSVAPLDAIAQQRKHWDFESREAERRRNIHLNVGGGDSEQQTGRALLEMAGIIGDGKYYTGKGGH